MVEVCCRQNGLPELPSLEARGLPLLRQRSRHQIHYWTRNNGSDGGRGQFLNGGKAAVRRLHVASTSRRRQALGPTGTKLGHCD